MDISTQSISKFFHRFHTILFAIFVLGGLIIMVLTLNGIIASSSASSASSVPTPSSAFDQQTIDKLNKLRTSDQQPAPLDLSGRSNPFVE